MSAGGNAFDGLREWMSAFGDHDKAITLLAGSDMAKLPPPRLWQRPPVPLFGRKTAEGEIESATIKRIQGDAENF